MTLESRRRSKENAIEAAVCKAHVNFPTGTLVTSLNKARRYAMKSKGD